MRRRSRDRGTLCAPFDHALWSAALAPALAEPEPRIAGRARAAEFATDVMPGACSRRGSRSSRALRIRADGGSEQRATSFSSARACAVASPTCAAAELALRQLGLAVLEQGDVEASSPLVALEEERPSSSRHSASTASSRCYVSRDRRLPAVPDDPRSDANFCPNCGAKRAPLSRGRDASSRSVSSTDRASAVSSYRPPVPDQAAPPIQRTARARPRSSPRSLVADAAIGERSSRARHSPPRRARAGLELARERNGALLDEAAEDVVAGARGDRQFTVKPAPSPAPCRSRTGSRQRPSCGSR